jgi:hypothetical protein
LTSTTTDARQRAARDDIATLPGSDCIAASKQADQPTPNSCSGLVPALKKRLRHHAA